MKKKMTTPARRNVRHDCLPATAGGMGPTMSEQKGAATRPRRNITWQEQPLSTPCEHQFEAIAGGTRFVFRQCRKCGVQEAV